MPISDNDEYDDVVAGVVHDDAVSTAAQIRNNTVNSVGVNPDLEAENQQMASALGVPVQSVRADPNTAKAQVASAQVPDDISITNPATAKVLADPDQHKIAHDDVNHLQGLENLTDVSTGADMLKAIGGGFQKVGGAAGMIAPSFMADAEAALGMPIDEFTQAQGADARSTFDNAYKPQTFAGSMAGFLPILATGFGAPVAMGLSSAIDTKNETGDVDSGLSNLNAAIQGELAGGAGLIAGPESIPFLRAGIGKFLFGTAKAGAIGAVQYGIGSAIQSSLLKAGGYDEKAQELAPTLEGLSENIGQMMLLHLGHVGTSAVIDHMVGQSAKAVGAQIDGQRLIQVNDTAGMSAFRNRNPEAFQNFMQHATADGPLENVYADANTLAQSGVDLKALADASPSAAEQLPAALASGGVIKIPTAEFATRVAGTDLAQSMIEHLRTAPDAMSQKESTEFFQSEAGKEMQATVERVLTAKQNDDAWQQSRQKVARDIKEKIVATGMRTSDAADVDAQRRAAFISVMADYAGKAPMDYYKERAAGSYTSDLQPNALTQQAPLTAPPVDETGHVALDHWSAEQALAQTDPAKWGQNATFLSREERNRIGSAPWRTYFGIGTGQNGGYEPEGGLPANRYQGKVKGAELYDMQRDPDGLMAKGRAMIADKQWSANDGASLYEKFIHDAGYKGYWVKGHNGLTAAMFHPVDVEPVNAHPGELHQGANGGEVGDRPLVGAPGPVKVDGEMIQFGPFHPARKAATDYMKSVGRQYEPPVSYAKVDIERAKRIAQAYADMPHAPDDPAVKASYDAMIKETLAQYQFIKATGLKVEPIEGKDPYGNPRNAILDVAKNNHLWFFPTEAGFGSSDKPYPGNPLEAPTNEYLGDRQLLANDVFRIVHDYFGHIKDGVGFRAEGEENAWQSHVSMYSPEAQGAMTSETRGQNSWVNFGPHGADTVYADQKTGLMPEWTWKEGRLSGADSGLPKGESAPEPEVQEQLAQPVDENAEPVEPNDELPTLQQSQRASFNPQTLTTSLLKGADLSSLIHEDGHFFLEMMTRDAVLPGAPERLTNDVDALMKWFGVEGKTAQDRLANWRGMDLEAQRPHHEQMATAFERYMFSGKAPSLNLQSAFRKMRAWMLHTYQSVKNFLTLHPEAGKLNPEIRQVFDRMLATDAEIKEMEATRSFDPLFKDADSAGMTPEEFKAYQQLGQDATASAEQEMQTRSLRDMKYVSGARSGVLKELQVQAGAARRAVKAEVTTEVLNEPVNLARDFLKRGVEGVEDAPHRLDIATMKEMYGDGPEADWKLLESKYGKYGVLGSDGLHPDDVAEMFGFRDGKELVDALLTAEDPRSKIAALTDQRMLERHGDLTDPQSLSDAADEAVHNDNRLKVLATEASAMNKAAGSPKLLVPAAKQLAENIVARLKIRDVKPARFTAAEVRAAKLMDKARGAGNLQDAAIQARNRLVQAQGAKAAFKAQKEIDKSLQYLKRFDNKATRKAVGADYMEQIDSLLGQYDLSKSTSLKEIERRTSLKTWLEDQQAQGYTPSIDSRLMDHIDQTSYKDLSVEGFRGLLDAVKSIEHLGRLKQKLIDRKEMREFKAVVDEFTSQTDKLPQKAADTNWGLSTVENKFLNAKSVLQSGISSLMKIEKICDWLDDGKLNGVMNRIVYRPISDAQGRHLDMNTTFAHNFRELASRLGDIDLKKVHEAPELSDPLRNGTAKFREEEIVALLANTANESNLGKLLDGNKWTKDNLRAFLDRVATPDHIAMANGLVREAERSWPERLAMEKRLGNEAPPKVEGRPYELKAGAIEGGYYPMIYDTSRSFDAEERANRKAAKTGALFGTGMRRATTDTGRMNERNKNYSAPVMLSLDAFARAMDDEHRNLAYREAIINAQKFLNNRTVRTAIEGTLGKEYYRQFTPWLHAIANDAAFKSTKGGNVLDYIENGAHRLRTNVTMMALGYRLSTILKHGTTAAAQSVGELGPHWSRVGASAFFGSPEKMGDARDFVFDRSSEMRHRMETMDRDFRDQLREMSASDPENALNNVKRFAFHGVAMSDMASALPTWLGAYHKGLSEGLSENDAIYYGDKVVRNAHGAGGTKDQAAIMRGSEVLKLTTMFYSFWNHMFNQQMDMIRTGQRVASGQSQNMKADVASLASRMLFYYIVPAVTHSMLSGPQKDDGKGWLQRTADDMIVTASSGIPLARSLASYFTGQNDYALSPQAQFAKSVKATSQDIAKTISGEGASQSWLKHAIETPGYMFGLPLGQAATDIQFIKDVMDGNQSPQDVSDWWNGIVYGHVKK